MTFIVVSFSLCPRSYAPFQQLRNAAVYPSFIALARAEKRCVNEMDGVTRGLGICGAKANSDDVTCAEIRKNIAQIQQLPARILQSTEFHLCIYV